MNKLTLQPISFATILLLGLGPIGCQNKRSPKLGDGEGRYSQSVADFNGKVFKLTTHEAINKGGVISSSEDAANVGADKENGLMKTFPAVKYTTDAKLVDSVPVLAKPNTSGVYEIHYTLTNTHLVVSKVAAEAYIPMQEKTYAEPASGGRLSVPLFGYPILGKVIREAVRNDRDEKTSRLTERSVMDIKDASHVQIDFSRFEEFGAIKKIDTFPVEFFTGPKDENEWYYGETVLSSPDKTAVLVGDSSTFTLFDVRQSLVKFQRHQSGLEVIGLAVDEKGKGNEANYESVAFIPGSFKDFKVEKQGRFREMKEQEEAKDLVHWKKTKFVQLDFSQMSSEWMKGQEGSYLYGGKTKNPRPSASSMRVVSIKLEPNFISIILENPTSNIRLHLAFLKKENRNYTPLVYHNIDNKIFGFYATKAPEGEARDHRVRRQEDVDKTYYVNRFNPNLKKITYHISKSSPDWTIPAIEASIKTWNEGFDKTGITIALDKTKRVDTGDIRYNVINMIDSKGATGNTGFYGYGPVLSDPFTGEVISATSTMHVHNFRLSIISQVRGYVLSKTGVLPNYYRQGQEGVFEILGLAAEKAYESLKAQLPFKYKIPDSVVKNDNLLEKVKKYSQYSNREFKERYSQYSRKNEMPVLVDNVEPDIQTMCPEVLNYIATVKKQSDGGKGYDQRELEVVETCAEKILLPSLVPTIVHEMGHNFGLRHNFGGSSDYYNFYADKDGKPTVNTASIMDYVPLEYRQLSRPGRYDVAAMRYAYGNQIQLNKDKQNIFIGLNHKLDLAENLRAKGYTLNDIRPYKYCSDYEARGAHYDPLCQASDLGWTAEQAVNFHIRQVNENFALGQYRWDRIQPRTHQQQADAFFHYSYPLMAFYAHWREKVSDYMQNRNLYLEGMTKEQYNKLLDDMEKDAKYGAFTREYRPLIAKIYKFFTGYAFLSDRYCLAESTENGNLALLEFNKFRKDVFLSKQTSIQNCRDQAAQESLSGRKLKLVTEFGYHASDIRFDLTAEGQNDASGPSALDILSTQPIREQAGILLNIRVIATQKGWETGLYPSFMDEPQFREDWLERVFKRLIEGVNPSDFLSMPELANVLKSRPDIGQKLAKMPMQNFFSEELTALQSLIMLTKIGAQVPGNLSATLANSEPIGGSIYSAGQGQGGSDIGNGISINTSEKAVFTRAAIQKYLQNKSGGELSVEEVASFAAVIDKMGFPKSQEEFDKMNGKEFFKAIAKMLAFMEQLSGDEAKAAKAQMILITYFPEIVSIFEDLGNVIKASQKELQSNAELKGMTDQSEAQKKILQLVGDINESKLAKDLFKKFKPFTAAEKVAAAKAKIEGSKDSGSETFSQQDLLLKFLLFR